MIGLFITPKINFKESSPHQKFTAIGKIIDEDVYQVNKGNDFVPFRRNIEFSPTIETPVKPLVS